MIALSDFDRRRLIAVVMICMIVVNLLVPIRQAHAVVPILAAPEIALGGFVGVVAVGAIGMELFGYSQQSDDMMAYANAVWVSGNQAMKDAVVSSYNAAVAAGNKTFAISAEVRDWIVDGYTGMFAISDPKGVASTISATGEQVTPLRYGDGDVIPSFTPPSGYLYVVGAGYATGITISTRYVGSKGVSAINIHNTSGYAAPTPGSRQLPGVYANIFPSTFTAADYKRVTSRYAAPMTLIPKSTVDNVLSRKDSIRGSFPMALPVPSGQDFIYTPTANPGADVRMRNDGTLADDAGKVYAPDQVTVKSVPVPRVATDAAGVPITDAAGKPVIAVPVGATGVGTAAVPGTLVNVRTGEAVQTKTGDTVANPPLDWASQPTTAINWAPLKMTGSALTRVFPFSIPWDVYAQLKIFNVQPTTPVIKVDVPEFWRAGSFVWHLKFEINFGMFDPVAVGIRWIGNIAFTVGLALAMRRFMPQ